MPLALLPARSVALAHMLDTTPQRDRQLAEPEVWWHEQATQFQASPKVLQPLDAQAQSVPPVPAARSGHHQFALEDVLRRSAQLRGLCPAESIEGSGAASSSSGSSLALTREKLIGRVFVGRPLVADFAPCLDRHGRAVVLGVGMSGEVHQAHRRADGRVCAVKSFEKCRLDDDQMHRLKSEVQISLEVDHPNIVRLLACYEDKTDLTFAMECCHGGDFGEVLGRHGRFTEEETQDIVRQMLWALLYLHDNGIVHRDLKLENFLVEDRDSYARVKLIDFGLSWVRDPEDDSGQMTRSCGTTSYMAPEVLEHRSYTHKADLWSLGVIVSSLLSGRRPRRGDTAAGRSLTCDLLGLSGLQWGSIMGAVPETGEGGLRDISEAARDFVERLLAPDPEERMDAQQALVHPWLLQCCGRPGGGACQREIDNVDATMIEGWRRFAACSPAMRALLAQLASTRRWPQGAMRRAEELFAECSQHRGTARLGDFERLLQRGSAGADSAAAKGLFADISSVRQPSAGSPPEQIGYSDFLASSLLGQFDLDHLVAEAFRMLDADRDGLVLRADLLAAAANEAAAGGDELLTLPEFARAIEQI